MIDLDIEPLFLCTGGQIHRSRVYTFMIMITDRDDDGVRRFMTDIDRSGFDGWFEEDDWSEYPRYECGPSRSTLQEALHDADDAWVLGMPCAPVYTDYADFFAEQIVEASKVEDTFTGAWLKACEEGRAHAARPCHHVDEGHGQGLRGAAERR